MYIMYVDESGDTAPLTQGGSKVLTLTGCIIEEKQKRPIEERLREIKRKYYQNADVEFKSNFLRYANPRITDTNISSPIKLFDQAQYDALQVEIQEFLKTISISIVSVVIDKKGYWTRYPSQNPYHAAYIFLMERFQTFLRLHSNSQGICIVDPREGRVVEKRDLDRELNVLHSRLQWENGGFWKPCPNIIEKILFSDSALTVGIQIADLYCYPIFHLFQYDKTPEEYEWYRTISAPKFYYHTTVIFSLTAPRGPVVNGTGLKFFPEESKKDFRFYA